MKVYFPISFLLLIAMIFCFSTVQAQEEANSIRTCFLKSDFGALSNYFDGEVRLSIEKEEEEVSKKEAEQRIRRFFSKNPIKDFKIIHEGGSGNKLRYLIGTTSSTSNNYRTYILYRQEKGKILISEVRIEAEK